MTDVALPAPAVAPEAPARPAFQIVPLRGLPVVGAVLVALVVAIASNRLWPLEFFHVAAGGLWTSFDLFLGFVLGPIIGRMAVPARIDLTTKLMPKLLLIMPTIVTCTLASGSGVSSPHSVSNASPYSRRALRSSREGSRR